MCRENKFSKNFFHRIGQLTNCKFGGGVQFYPNLTNSRTVWGQAVRNSKKLTLVKVELI